MPDLKIIKDGPLVLPEFWHQTGTVVIADRDYYKMPEAKTWLSHPIKSESREVPIAYLPNALAWQSRGLEPAAYDRLLVWKDTKDYPVRVPKVVILRVFSNEDLFASIVALAPQLNAAGIMVVRDPYDAATLQSSFYGIIPALPIVSTEVMDPGSGQDPIPIPVVKPEHFVGGEILEIWDSGERTAFGLLKSVISSTTNTQSLAGYDVVFPTTTDLITFHRTVQYFHSNNATGITTSSIDTWNSSVTTVLQSNPSPPPGFIIHAMGVHTGPDQSYGAPRFPALHTVSSGSVHLEEWTELMTHSVDLYLEWIPRCSRYKGVFAWAFGTPIADPIEFHSDTMFGKIDNVTLDGINPQYREALDHFMELAGTENFELVEFEWSNDLAPSHFSIIKAQIESFFGITLT